MRKKDSLFDRLTLVLPAAPGLVFALLISACGGDSTTTSGASEVIPSTSSSSSTDGVLCDYIDNTFNASASVNAASMSEWTCTETSRVLAANGLPDHETGTFPNAGNPNAIEEQTVSATFSLSPLSTDTATELGGPRGTTGYSDDDGDGLLSATEFAAHRATIVAAVHDKVSLRGKKKRLPLQGLMLSPVAIHDAPLQPVEQLVVMGRFQMADTSDQLRFEIGLFGLQTAEQSFRIKATNPSVSLTNELVLTPDEPKAMLFAKAAN